MASGIHAQGVADEFLEHANEEQAHADQIARRIVQLGGEPDLMEEVLAKEEEHADDLVNMLEQLREDRFFQP